jgi:two-component system, NarL family, nitrate/nitrite response regulator NarL
VLVVDDPELIALSMASALRAKEITAECSGVDRAAVRAAARRTVRAPRPRPRPGRAGLPPARCGPDCAAVASRLFGARADRDVAGGADRGGAVALGANAWLSKTRPVTEIVDTMLAVFSGERVLTNAERRELLTRHETCLRIRAAASELLLSLTARERIVLDQMIAGKQAAAIAQDLVVSLSTVRTQSRSILSKLGVRSQLDAVALVRGLE